MYYAHLPIISLVEGNPPDFHHSRHDFQKSFLRLSLFSLQHSSEVDHDSQPPIMPQSLRKACHACTSAKRRCIPQLPKCPRCVEKELACAYDLEPVSSYLAIARKPLPVKAYKSANRPLDLVFPSVASAHLASMRSFGLNGFDSKDGLPMIANSETFSLALRHLRRIPLCTVRHQSTPFAHARIFSACRRESLPSLREGVDDTSESAIFQQLLQAEKPFLLSVDVQSLTFTEFLGSFNKLIAVILGLFLSNNAPTDVAEAAEFNVLVEQFISWRQHLYAVVPQKLGGELSAWQAWVIAETARRSIIAGVIMTGTLEILQKGYCHLQPLSEALPFDARTGLWEAETEEEWQAMAAVHGGPESSLMSWREFIESGGPAPRGHLDGMLQRLLLVGYFSKAAADCQLEDNPIQAHLVCGSPPNM